MRILVCAWDLPYPARGGGRADIWRRIESFVRLGNEVMLVNLFDPAGPRVPTDEALAYVDSVVSARYSFAIKRSKSRTLRQILNMGRIPWHVATRIPDADENEEIAHAARAFAPDLIWLDGPWFGELGRELQRDLGAPIAYRSHNLEHLYLKRQAAAAASRRNRIAWRLACIGLKRYQLRLMADARQVFDISLVDMETWRELGITNISWLPPLPELALVGKPAERVPIDVVFVGGLRTPNNVQGVRWLVTSVLPLLQRERPDVTVGLVGSYPDPDLVAELAANPSVQTHYDVADVAPYHFGAAVLVNPVAVGSGVQLKMLDMLMTEAPIVTRSQGLSGLPESSAALFDVADTPQDFAAAILRGLANPGIDAAGRAELRRQFTIDSVQTALDLVFSP
jgi:hypothetical protein